MHWQSLSRLSHIIHDVAFSEKWSFRIFCLQCMSVEIKGSDVIIIRDIIIMWTWSILIARSHGWYRVLVVFKLCLQIPKLGKDTVDCMFRIPWIIKFLQREMICHWKTALLVHQEKPQAFFLWLVSFHLFIILPSYIWLLNVFLHVGW